MATVAVTLYVRQYYLSMRDAKPVLEMLERRTPGDLNAAFNALLDGPRLKGPGASKVRHAVLNALASTTDGERLDRLFGIILAGQDDGRLLFKRKKEWDVIKAATERHDLKPWQNVRFFVTKDTNDVTVRLSGSALESRILLPCETGELGVRLQHGTTWRVRCAGSKCHLTVRRERFAALRGLQF